MRKQTWLLVLLLLMLNAHARAQSLFTYLPDSLSGFDSTRIALLDSFRNYPFYDSVMVVEVADVYDIQDSGDLMVNLPGGTAIAKLHRLQVDDLDHPSNGYAWDGFFVGALYNDDLDFEPDYDGQVHIFKKDGELSGLFQPFDDRTQYSLISLKDNKYILARYSISFENANSLACDASISTNLTTASSSPGPCSPTSILVLVTPEAALFSPESEINKAMQLLDGATYNTLDILNSYCKFKLAGIRYLSPGQFSTSTNIFTDAQNLSTNAWANYYRDETNADLVICLTNADYYDHPVNGYRYVGKTLAIGPAKDDAFSIIEIGEMNNRFTFSHEVGHLMGCRHQQTPINNTDPDDAGDGHGWHIKKGNKSYNDIMHVKTSIGTREHYYSNPGLMLHSKIFGDNPYNNAGATMMANGCTTSEFKDDGSYLLDGIITGTSAAATGYTVTLNANHINGIAQFDWDWWASDDGGANWVYLMQNTGIGYGGITFTMPDVQYVVIALKITDHVGQTKLLYKTIANTHPKWNFPQPQPNSGLKPSNITKTGNIPSGLFINPNPASGVAKIAVDVPKNLMNESVKIIVSDVFGKQIAVKAVNSAQEIWDFNTDNLTSGTYFVQLRGNGLNINHKLVIAK